MEGRVRKSKGPRSDKGKKRTEYLDKLDTTGKTVKENLALKSFWSSHTMEDIKLLSSTDLDKVIEQWILIYETAQIKRKKHWWYPDIMYVPKPKPKKKDVNVEFNTSFRNR